MGFVGHWCGGVLLNGNDDDYWVLTAAHCISKYGKFIIDYELID